AVGVCVSDHTSAPVLRQPDVGWSQAPAVALFIGSSHRPTLLLQRGLPALYRSGPSRLRSPAFPSHRDHSARDGQQRAIQGRSRTAAFSFGALSHSSETELIRSICCLLQRELIPVLRRELVDQPCSGEAGKLQVALSGLDCFGIPVHLYVIHRKDGIGLREAVPVLRGELVDETVPAETHEVQVRFGRPDRVLLRYRVLRFFLNGFLFRFFRRSCRCLCLCLCLCPCFGLSDLRRGRRRVLVAS